MRDYEALDDTAWAQGWGSRVRAVQDGGAAGHTGSEYVHLDEPDLGGQEGKAFSV
jgi:hypothetical protein